MTSPTDPVHAFHPWKNCGAFAAILDDDTLIAWGDKNYGGSVPAFSPKVSVPVDRSWGGRLLGYSNQKSVSIKPFSIISSRYGFTVLFQHDDASVQVLQTWGNSSCDGISFTPLPSAPSVPKDMHVVGIASTHNAFTVLFESNDRQTQLLQSWGDNYNYDAPDIKSTLDSFPKAPSIPDGKKVVAIASTGVAFAAILDDDTLLTWGDPNYGGTTPDLNGKTVTAIVSTYYAFTALLSDQTLVSWGDSYYGGTTPDLNGKTVTAIASTFAAFAAVCTDGSLVACGNFLLSDQYGNATFEDAKRSVSSQLKTSLEPQETITSIPATTLESFQLQTSEHHLCVGYLASGINSVSLSDQVNLIASTAHAYLFLNKDGSVAGSLGDLYDATIPSGLDGNRVAIIASADYLFTAVCTDGSVF